VEEGTSRQKYGVVEELKETLSSFDGDILFRAKGAKILQAAKMNFRRPSHAKYDKIEISMYWIIKMVFGAGLQVLPVLGEAEFTSPFFENRDCTPIHLSHHWIHKGLSMTTLSTYPHQAGEDASVPHGFVIRLCPL
jgi:hypothetical protein